MTVSSEQNVVGSKRTGEKRLSRSVFVFICLLPTVVPLLTGLPADAQQAAKVSKVGWLGSRSASAPARQLFRRELHALGYVEGKNMAIEYRYAEGRLERLPTLADELIRLKVDVLLTPSTPAALAAKDATSTIPIVFYSGSDPVALGLIDSLARPGGNITGFTTIGAVLAGKRLELLKETIPRLFRVAALWNPQDATSGQSSVVSQRLVVEV